MGEFVDESDGCEAPLPLRGTSNHSVSLIMTSSLPSCAVVQSYFTKIGGSQVLFQSHSSEMKESVFLGFFFTNCSKSSWFCELTLHVTLSITNITDNFRAVSKKGSLVRIDGKQVPAVRDDAVDLIWRQVAQKLPMVRLSVKRSERLVVKEWWALSGEEMKDDPRKFRRSKGRGKKTVAKKSSSSNESELG